jgi:hypothetical protein
MPATGRGEGRRGERATNNHKSKSKEFYYYKKQNSEKFNYPNSETTQHKAVNQHCSWSK